MKAFKERGYLCPLCREWHFHKNSASNCCFHRLEMENRWVCSNCYAYHKTQKEAEICCRKEEEK